MSEVPELGIDDLSEVRKPLRFVAENGLIVDELRELNTEELAAFFKENEAFLDDTISNIEYRKTLAGAQQMLRDKKYQTFGIRQDPEAELAGILTFEQETASRVSMGLAMAEKLSGQGIMSNAVRTMVKNMFAAAEIRTIRGYVKHDNFRSRRLLEHLGFQFRGERMNVHVYYDLDKEDLEDLAN